MSDIKFKCPKCRSETFKVPRRNLRNTDKLTCAKCGFTDTYERIIKPQAAKIAADAIKKAFKGLR